MNFKQQAQRQAETWPHWYLLNTCHDEIARTGSSFPHRQTFNNLPFSVVIIITLQFRKSETKKSLLLLPHWVVTF